MHLLVNLHMRQPDSQFGEKGGDINKQTNKVRGKQTEWENMPLFLNSLFLLGRNPVSSLESRAVYPHLAEYNSPCG